jgi:hypothetical protein
VNSIPEILNFGEKLAQSASKRGVKVGPTKYLQSIVDQGYRLTIFQSEFADYCTGARFYECITYNSASLRPTLALPIRAPERAALIGLKFLALSDILQGFSGGWNIGALMLRRLGWPVPLYDPNVAYSSSVGSLEAMDVLSKRLRSARSGDAFFVHLLFPHFPYVVNRDCSYLPWTTWVGLDSPKDVRQRAYDEQVRCGMRMVESELAALGQSPAGANTVIILHGDHGSRIVDVHPNAENMGKIANADMIAGFSTLFAIRAPGVRPGYFVERQPIVPLLRDFAASGFHAAPQPNPPRQHMVYLANRDWKPVRRVPLPASWTKGFDRPVAGH